MTLPVSQPTNRPSQLARAPARAKAVLHVDFQVSQSELVDLADQRHPAHVLQLPLELPVQVGAPVVQVAMRVVFEPFRSASDEEGHAALDVERAVVERDAQAADVRVARREEPLAQVREVVVGAHDVESVFGEVVVH
jgi:hypothetical protein